MFSIGDDDVHFPVMPVNSACRNPAQRNAEFAERRDPWCRYLEIKLPLRQEVFRHFLHRYVAAGNPFESCRLGICPILSPPDRRGTAYRSSAAHCRVFRIFRRRLRSYFHFERSLACTRMISLSELCLELNNWAAQKQEAKRNCLKLRMPRMITDLSSGTEYQLWEYVCRMVAASEVR